MKMFAIRDSKAEGFNKPFFAGTAGLAERDFREACNDKDSHLSRHKADFSLYYVGEFDHVKGVFRGEAQPVHICNAE